MSKEIAFVGAGLSCAVIARHLAEAGVRCVLFEKRDHIAGNCHTRRDPETGVMVHAFGPHIFHTSNERVWDYVNRFADFGPFVNRVKAVTERGVFSLPVNLLTLNQLFGMNLNPKEAAAFVAEKAKPFKTGREETFEEVALSLVGEEIYRAFFYGYTKKQWGCEPSELPGDIIKRLPIRFTYEDDYYRDTYQGIPREGYTAMIAKILDHPGIEVKLNHPVAPTELSAFGHAVWSGPLDAFYGFRHGRLSYRTVFWKEERSEGDAQGTACLNNTSEKVPYTRTIEHKFFTPWEKHERTLLSTEYSKATEPHDDPYYPIRSARDLDMLDRYVADALEERAWSFIGRLGTYRYLDMHLIIEESLSFAERALAAIQGGAGREWPVFPIPREKICARS